MGAGIAEFGARDWYGVAVTFHDSGYLHNHPHGPWWAIAVLVVMALAVYAAGLYVQDPTFARVRRAWTLLVTAARWSVRKH